MLNLTRAIVLFALVAIYLVYIVKAEDGAGLESNAAKCDKIVTINAYARPGASLEKFCKAGCRDERMNFVSSVKPNHKEIVHDSFVGDYAIIECCCSKKRWGWGLF